MSDNTDTPTEPKAPEAVGEDTQDDAPEEMSLLPNEVMQLQSIRGRVNQVLALIGQLEVQKAQKLALLAQMEAQAQNVMTAAGKRLEIPDNTPWQASPDGKVTMVSPEDLGMQTPPDEG